MGELWGSEQNMRPKVFLPRGQLPGVFSHQLPAHRWLRRAAPGALTPHASLCTWVKHAPKARKSAQAVGYLKIQAPCLAWAGSARGGACGLSGLQLEKNREDQCPCSHPQLFKGSVMGSTPSSHPSQTTGSLYPTPLCNAHTPERFPLDVSACQAWRPCHP